MNEKRITDGESEITVCSSLSNGVLTLRAEGKLREHDNEAWEALREAGDAAIKESVLDFRHLDYYWCDGIMRLLITGYWRKGKCLLLAPSEDPWWAGTLVHCLNGSSIPKGAREGMLEIQVGEHRWVHGSLPDRGAFQIYWTLYDHEQQESNKAGYLTKMLAHFRRYL